MTNIQGRRFTPAERLQKRTLVVEAYNSGASVEDAARSAECSPCTARNFLAEAGVPLRATASIQLPDGMLTAREAAALIGISHPSFNTLQHKGYGPPRAERPKGAHGHYTYYWRADVEAWMQRRAERRLHRIRDREARRKQRQEDRAASVLPEVVMDWEALLKAVDAKREAEGFSWTTVCHLSGVDAGHISRLRKGFKSKHGLGAFVRLALWVAGSVPDEIKRFTKQTESPEKTTA